ncbi:MAG: hypothetical protein SFY92_01675 [Verrucomicrobiae bacterium]|nr:hypothetical protein [Verrucomicrobiae bacterium]
MKIDPKPLAGWMCVWCFLCLAPALFGTFAWGVLITMVLEDIWRHPTSGKGLVGLVLVTGVMLLILYGYLLYAGYFLRWRGKNFWGGHRHLWIGTIGFNLICGIVLIIWGTIGHIPWPCWLLEVPYLVICFLAWKAFQAEQRNP